MRNLASLGIEYLIMGVCIKDGSNGNLVKCAWEPDECPAGSFWRPYDTNPRIMGECKPNDQPIGRCALDECAFRASDCEFPSSFSVDDPTCKIERDINLGSDADNQEFTQFGSCKHTDTGDHFCVLDPTDCDESGFEVYVNPSETKAAGVDCNCAEVHITGCLIAGEAHCATSDQGCRTNSEIVSPHTQRVHRVENIKATDSLDCRLCQRVYTSAPTPMPKLPTSSPITSTSTPTKMPTHTHNSVPSQTGTTQSDSSMGRINTAALTNLGVAVVGVLAAFL